MNEKETRIRTHKVRREWVTYTGSSKVLRTRPTGGGTSCHDPTLKVATMGQQVGRNRINYGPMDQ